LKLLLDNSKEYLLRWRDEYIDLVQGGFQDLFTNLVDHFLSLCLKSGFNSASASPDKLPEATPSLVLLLALLSVYIYQTAVPQITEVLHFTCDPIGFRESILWQEEYLQRRRERYI